MSLEEKTTEELITEIEELTVIKDALIDEKTAFRVALSVLAEQFDYTPLKDVIAATPEELQIVSQDWTYQQKWESFVKVFSENELNPPADVTTLLQVLKTELNRYP